MSLSNKTKFQAIEIVAFQKGQSGNPSGKLNEKSIGVNLTTAFIFCS